MSAQRAAAWREQYLAVSAGGAPSNFVYNVALNEVLSLIFDVWVSVLAYSYSY